MVRRSPGLFVSASAACGLPRNGLYEKYGVTARAIYGAGIRARF